MAARISEASSPVKARWPLRASKRQAPKANTSVRLSMAWPFACSGDMYAAVPMIWPRAVAAAVMVGDWLRSTLPGTSGGAIALARPKSRIFTRPSMPTLTFAGLRSRWTIPLLVSRFEPIGDLDEQRQRFIERESRPRAMRSASVLAFDELHHQEPRVAIGLKTMDGRNVLMIQRSKRLRLALEPRQPLLVFREDLRQHLDRHLALELRVARPVHLAHATRAERAEDLVVAESAAEFQSHLNPPAPGASALRTSSR